MRHDFGHRMKGRTRWYHQHIGRRKHATNGGEISHRIETQIFIKRGIHRMPNRGEIQGVAIGLRARDHLGRDVAVGTRTVFHNHGLPQLQ